MTLLFNPAHRPPELFGDAVEWLKNGKGLCLATLVNIEGSAPYPVGAQMLIDEYSNFLGQITGGCAEQAIADQAGLAIAAGENQCHRYGLDSPYFDIKLPCGSGIDVYFDVTLDLASCTHIAKELDERREVVQEIAAEPATINKVYKPTPRLILIGQGPILVQLALLSRQSGIDVACVAQNDDTAVLCEQHDLASVSLLTATSDFDLNLEKRAAVVSLFHEHELENSFLVQAAKSEAFFIGALGSKNTHQARTRSLLELGLSSTEIDRIRGPVGLDIGANSPSQIAVSILAEIIQEMNRRGL